MNRRISIQNRDVKPESFITKGKQRLKQHVDTVYLNNGDEFEIELYNPTTNKVLAQIELNGKSIGSGIVLRPGERVFLERYLDEAKKFLFETYSVDGNNQDVLNAIKNNGDVTVKFYNEYFPISTTTWISNGLYYGNLNFPSTGGYNTYSTTTLGDNVSYTSSISNNVNSSNAYGTLSRSIETGRVEKGSDSNQSFAYDNSTFNYFPSWTNWWKIKPISQKVMVKEELVVYCTECGAKRKKDNHKFCPHCGTKY